MKPIHENQVGTVLVTALTSTMLLFGIAGAYLIVSQGGWDHSTREIATIEARLAVEDGLNLSIAELKSGADSDGNGIGAINATAADGRNITVTATNLGGNVYRIHSRARLNRSHAGAEVVVERLPTGVLSFTPRAAITAQGPVTTLGNINVDGRDWNITGTAITGSGVYGISSMSTISNGGSSTVGGNGWAPSKPANPLAQEPLADWADGVNKDSDGATDEESFDGVDNDGDGSIDEDTAGYPTNPDVMLSLAPNTLKNAAIASNTYFTSQAQFDAAVAANGNTVPGGKIIYCDFPHWQPVTLGATFNNPPSVIVHHNATGTAEMKNVHGSFVGLLLADFLTHLNGDFVILGAVQSFGNAAVGNSFGNGNAQIKLCTAALGNLPTAGGAAKVRIKGWNRAVAH